MCEVEHWKRLSENSPKRKAGIAHKEPPKKGWSLFKIKEFSLRKRKTKQACKKYLSKNVNILNELKTVF